MGAGEEPLKPRAGARIGGALAAPFLAAALAVALPQGAKAHDETDADQVAQSAHLCKLIEHAARSHDLPPEFFARLIWKESRFDVRAVSPKGAQGVAQFMPGTAKLRGLDDPFDPAQAISASAAYLAELRDRFGNLGLAAAAYNGGEDRVQSYVARRGGLPGETLEYVHSITFRPASWFREDGREVEPRPLVKDLSFEEACSKLPVMKTRAVLFEGATLRPWGAQVAGNVRQGAALRQFARVQARYSHIIGDRQPMVVSTRAGLGRKRIWSVQIGAGSRREAVKVCARLRSAGAPCMVKRN